MYCKYCDTKKSKDDFGICKRTEDKIYRRNKCKSCRNKDKQKRRNSIREKIRRIKQKGECNYCGFEDYRALHFHHVEKDKNFNISNAPKKVGWEKTKEEIEKCILVCANCHAIEHYGE